VNPYELHCRSIDAMSEGEYHTALGNSLGRTGTPTGERNLVRKPNKNQVAKRGDDESWVLDLLTPEARTSLEEWRKTQC
jgi:hypothetical protein